MMAERKASNRAKRAAVGCGLTSVEEVIGVDSGVIEAQYEIEEEKSGEKEEEEEEPSSRAKAVKSPKKEVKKEGWKPDANIIEIQKLKGKLMKLGVWEKDADYREWLKENFEVESSKELSPEEKKEAIEKMKYMIKSVEETEKIEREIERKAEQKSMF